MDVTAMAALLMVYLGTVIGLLVWGCLVAMRIDKRLKYQNDYLDRRSAQREVSHMHEIEEAVRNMPSSPFLRRHSVQ